MTVEATSSQLSQTLVFRAFETFINQRSGISFSDYGDWKAFRSEGASISKMGREARQALKIAEMLPWDAVTMKESFGAFSGRLTPVIREDGKLALSYCTGQYWPTEYRAAARAVLQRYIEQMRPKRQPQPGENFQSIADIARANQAAGGHWFSRENKRFARSRVLPGLYRGQGVIWFVSSEKIGWDDSSPRRFSVRVFDVTTADINTCGEFGGYRSAREAQSVARDLAQRDKSGKHIRPSEQSTKCEFCGHYAYYCTAPAKTEAA